MTIEFNSSITTIHHFVKKEIEKPWGEFDALLELKESEVKPMQDVLPQRPAAQQPAPFQITSIQPVAMMEINCPACTLLNPANAAKCDICGEDLTKVLGHISRVINI